MPQPTREITLNEINPAVYSAAPFHSTLLTPNNEAPKSACSYRFMLVTDGAAELVMNGKTVKMQENDILYLLPGQVYAIKNKYGDFGVINIHFDFIRYRPKSEVTLKTVLEKEAGEATFGELFCVAEAPFFSCSALLKNEPELFGELLRSAQIFKSYDIYSHKKAEFALGCCLAELARRGTSFEALAKKRSQKSCELILSYINKNFRSELDAAELSRVSGYHPYHVGRLVKQATGMSLHDYVLKVKIKHASELLRETDMSVTDVAQYLSFSDASHFSKVFRRVCGTSPRGWRRRADI